MFKKILIVGDFNINIANVESFETSYLKGLVKERAPKFLPIWTDLLVIWIET